MSAFSYNQAANLPQSSGMGVIQVIAALVGGLAQAGAGIYQTTALQKATKGQQQINRAVLQVDAELRRRELELIAEKNRRDSLARQARSILTSRNAQLGFAVVAVLGVAYVVTKGLSSGS